MRTLVVSDLHIGVRGGRAALDDDAVLTRLADAAAAFDRLVLLGDVLELRQQPIRDALAAASRVLPRIVAGMAGQREVVLVAGNHDHELFADWVRRRAALTAPPPLTLETPVDCGGGEPLAVIEEQLRSSGARVRSAYPGVWLRDDVYATHGHYLDRHTTAPGFERLGAGAMGKLLRVPAEAMPTPDEYERILAPIYAWMLAISERNGPELDAADGGGSSRILRMLRAGGFRGRSLQIAVNIAAALLQRAGLGELSGDLSPRALWRTELRGFGIALANLGVSAPYVIFGHTHRAGPLPGELSSEWQTPSGIALFNSGSWVHEGEAFLDRAQASVSPYRPGFAIELEHDGPPRLVNLLDA